MAACTAEKQRPAALCGRSTKLELTAHASKLTGRSARLAASDRLGPRNRARTGGAPLRRSIVTGQNRPNAPRRPRRRVGGQPVGDRQCRSADLFEPVSTGAARKHPNPRMARSRAAYWAGDSSAPGTSWPSGLDVPLVGALWPCSALFAGYNAPVRPTLTFLSVQVKQKEVEVHCCACPANRILDELGM